MMSYLTQINNILLTLSKEAKESLTNMLSIKKVRKGDFLLKQGEICTCSFFVEAGMARKFYVKNDKEITTALFFPNDIAISFTSYTLQQPGREFIQALEDCTVHATPFGRFQDLKKIYPELVALDLMMTEYYTMILEERLFQFHTLDATQRYLLLLKEQPHLIQSVQLTFIASYLGISLETLSRIRANI